MKANECYKVSFEDAEYIRTNNGVDRREIGSFLVAVLDTQWGKLAAEGRSLEQKVGNELLYLKFREWYKALISELAPKHPLLKIFIEEQLPQKMMDKVWIRHGNSAKEQPDWKFVKGLVSGVKSDAVNPELIKAMILDVCVQFDSLNDLVRTSTKFITEVLDISNSTSELSVLQRYALFINDNSGGDIPQVFGKKYYPAMRLEFVVSLDSANDVVIEKKLPELNAQNIKDHSIAAHGYWTTYSLESIFALELNLMSTKEIVVRQCGNCGRYFLPYSIVNCYCSRPDPKNPARTCKEVGAQTKYQQQLERDEAKKLFRKVNNRHQNWVRRNKKHNSLAAEYNAWKDWAEQLLCKTENRDILFEEFSALIDKPTTDAFEDVRKKKNT